MKRRNEANSKNSKKKKVVHAWKTTKLKDRREKIGSSSRSLIDKGEIRSSRFLGWEESGRGGKGRNVAMRKYQMKEELEGGISYVPSIGKKRGSIL